MRVYTHAVQYVYTERPRSEYVKTQYERVTSHLEVAVHVGLAQTNVRTQHNLHVKHERAHSRKVDNMHLVEKVVKQVFGTSFGSKKGLEVLQVSLSEKLAFWKRSALYTLSVIESAAFAARSPMIRSSPLGRITLADEFAARMAPPKLSKRERKKRGVRPMSALRGNERKREGATGPRG
eukprot:5645424-Pleurochrysis_carterae.AAC.1